MLQIDLFETREVPLRIPVILFFHRLLSTMPTQMIRSEMVENYIKALTYMTKVDKATEQTISYSLHNLVDKVSMVVEFQARFLKFEKILKIQKIDIVQGVK